MNGIIIIRIKGMAVNAPIKTNNIASLPFPCINISCPGRTDRNDSSSVAPVKIEGIKSSIVCVIARETTKTINEFVDKKEKTDKFAIKIAVIVFMWIPGVIPVIVPKNIPVKAARMNSNIIF